MPSIINANTSGGLISQADTSGILQLQTASTTALTIDGSQNVGIGTASPLTPLHVVGAIQSQRSGATQYARMVNSAGTATFISDNQASGTYTGFQFQGLSTASGTPVTYAAINANGIGLGAATPSSGTGITFPATQSASSDANTLDDYEEGTWTPTDGSGAGLTLSGASGYYVKIGKQVTAWAQVTYPTTANTAVARIASYPFTTANTEPARGGGMLGYKTIATVSTVLLQSNNTIMDFRDSTGSVVTNATVSNGNFYFAFTYYTA